MEKILTLKNVEKYYGSETNLTKAVNGISFEVDKGEFVGIMGASGSVKTTLLNCISTIDSATSGEILIAGVNVTDLRGSRISKFRREELGFIFQDFNLLDTLTGYENIALSLSICGLNSSAIEKKVNLVANKLLITDVLSKYPYEMSGGQQQRIACARAIVGDPKLILADEPTGALDSKSSYRLLETFKALNEQLSSTILMVTHDAFTASYAKRIIFIKDGRIFTEIAKGNDTRKEFFSKIIQVITVLGGDMSDVI